MDEQTKNWIKIEKDNKEIYILGTAHVLQDSKLEVEQLIAEVDPDAVCVELCESRYNSLKDKNRWKNLDIIKVIREGKGFLLFANMILTSFQKRIGTDLESAPGDEMIAAFEIAEQKGKKVVLADRDINVTLRRAWRLSSFSDKMKIVDALFEVAVIVVDQAADDAEEHREGDHARDDKRSSPAHIGDDARDDDRGRSAAKPRPGMDQTAGQGPLAASHPMGHGPTERRPRARL